MKRIENNSCILVFVFSFLLLYPIFGNASTYTEVPADKMMGMAVDKTADVIEVNIDDQVLQDVAVPVQVSCKYCESEISLIKKYDQDFDIKLPKSSDKEALIISNLDKLGIKLDDIDEFFYDNLRKDIADLNATLKSMRSRSRKNKDATQMVDSLKVSSRNASQIYSFMHKHHDFIKGYRIINFYKSLPVDSDKLVAWVIARHDGIYPLLDYVDVIDSQAYWIYWLRHAHYPNMVKKIQMTKKAMMKSASMLRKTRAFKDEFHVKQEADMKAAMLSAQQEIARTQNKMLVELHRTR